jgi:hypothetical protein
MTLPSVLTGCVSLAKLGVSSHSRRYDYGDMHRDEVKVDAAVTRGYGGRDPTRYEASETKGILELILLCVICVMHTMY